jgi:hypothetical protein
MMRWCYVLSAVLVVVFAAVVAQTVVGAGDRTVTRRPLQEFLDAQCSTSCCDPMGAWCGLDPGRGDAYSFAIVNVLNLNAQWMEPDVPLGTTLDGTVTERPLPDGRAEVTVVLHTRHALTWVFGDEWPATVLGSSAYSVAYEGAAPAWGDATTRLVFINPSAGYPFPSLTTLLGCPEPGQELVSLDITATASGPLHEAFGVPEGTPGMMTMQAGLVAGEGGALVPRGPMPADGWCPATFPVILRAVGSGAASP